MKLFISKNQDKGLMGGISFVLHARVELLSEEQELIKKYKAHKEVLLTKTISVFGRELDLAITIGGLTEGEKFKCKDIADIIAYEENIKEACKNFKIYIEVMKAFGGEDVYEFE